MTPKLLEENIGKTFFDIKCSNIFFDQSPQAKEIKADIKAFAQQRKPSTNRKDNLWNGRKYLQTMPPTRG